VNPRKPTYPLADITRLAQTENKRIVTTDAQSRARNSFDFDLDDIYAAIAALKEREFYKTMPSEKNPGLFQDVYHPRIAPQPFPDGIEVYCKVQIDSLGRVVVIAFKPK